MQTTRAYNPKANGIIQRFPCNLKALMARAPLDLAGTPYFTEGGRQHHCRRKSLQGKHKDAFRFFPRKQKPTVKELHSTVAKISPCQQTYQDTRKSYTRPDIHTVSHVLSRVCTTKQTLTQPYTSPYKVLQRKPKVFQLQIRNNKDKISISLLKPEGRPAS